MESEIQLRLDAICDWVHHAETGRVTEEEAVAAIELLVAAARGFLPVRKAA